MTGPLDSLWGEWSKYDAKGMKGSEALVQEITRIVYESGIKSPITSKRGVDARLHYLESAAGRAALAAQGVTPRALKSWAAGKAVPSAQSREKIDSAYWTRRKENMIRSGSLVRILNNDGRGRPIEIYPVDQSHVVGGYSSGPGTGGYGRHNVDQVRSVTGNYIWDDLVAAWADGDTNTIEEIWIDVIQDIDSMYAAYAYVSSVSIGA
ncbi:hypothetical protein [Streptomyces sp. DW26H14]|uniref:hypothetical protein n=1 Tax=Streptomyces sp. DW26H14 TaxID=3435395 RepID=UPI00403E262D